MHNCRTMPIKRLLPVLLAAAASAQTACPAGWTPSPATRDWPDKCYKEIGPIAKMNGGAPFQAGRNHSGCKQLCAEQSATARLACFHSAAELHFVVNTSHIDGWVGYEQDKQAADYSEPGGGWGWTTCSSTFSSGLWANVSAPYIASPHGAAHASPLPSPVN